MASCDVCEQEQAAFIVGNMQTGDQLMLGPGCMARFGLEQAKLYLDPAELDAAIQLMAPTPAPKAPDEPVEPSGRPKRKPATTDTPPPEGAPGGPDEVPAPAQDGGD